MKKLVIAALLALAAVACKQTPETDTQEIIVTGMQTLDRALMQKDTLTLSKLLHEDLSLGHSNGWIETRSGLPQTLLNRGVVYTTIAMQGAPEFTHQSDRLITTRRNLDVDGMVNETPFSVKLNVLEVWVMEAEHWQLLARQSVNRRE